MSAKVILVLCAQALFIQSAISSCLGSGAIAAPTLIAPGCAGNAWASNGLIGNGLIGNGLIGNGCAGNWASNGVIRNGIIGNGLIGNGLAGLEIIPTTGGELLVSSVSGTGAPSGLSIESENVYEGSLSVAGELPFVSAVALEGVLSSAGAGAVSYSCGNGVTAIESIAPSAAASGAAGAYGLGAGYGAGAAGAYGLGAGYGAGAAGAYGLGAGYGAGAAGAYGLGAGYGAGAAAIAPAALELGYGGRSCGCGLY